MTPDLNAAQQADILAARGVGGAHAMSVGPSDVHVDAALSNLAVAYRPNQGKFIADLVMPVIGVAKRSDKYFKYGASTFTDLQRTDIASQMGRPAQASWNTTTDSYAVKDHGLMDFVPADVESNADAPLRPLMDTTEVLTERLLLSREYRVAQVFADTGNFGSNTSDLSGAGWDLPSSDPVKAIEDAKNSMYIEANALVLGNEVWTALRRHPSVERYILSRASTSLGAVPLTVTPELFAQAFDLDAVYIGRAKYNTGNPGATFSQSYIWGKIAALVKIEKTPAMQRTEAFGYTFRFAPAGGAAFETRTWYDHSIGVRGGTWIKVTHSDTEKVVAGQYSGFLFYNAVA